MRKIKKAQGGEEVIRGSRPGLGVFKTTKKRTTVGGLAKPYSYKRESIDTTGYAKGKPTYKLKTEEGESDKLGLTKVSRRSSKTVSRKNVPSILKSLKMKKGGKVMMKRADGSVSQRGLWDNIRAAAKRNKAAGKPGKKPTAAMLKQERKIKAKGK
jgi:hypothetical protein